MKTIISLAFGVLLSISVVSTVSAQVYYPYNNGGYQSQNSYYYTSGCTQYYHDAYTNTERYVRYMCQNQNQNTYTYTQPVTYTYYTQPTTYTSYNSYNTSPYYTYGYNRSSGTWYPGYTDSNVWSFFGNNNSNYYNNNYNNDYYYPQTTNCYYAGGYYVCQ